MMRLCLSCKHLSGGGSVYCGHCGRSFGVRLCANKHRNAPHVRCCTTCASPVLTEPTPFLRLGCLPLGLAGLCALALWKSLLAHLCAVLALTANLAAWAVAVLLNTSACTVKGTVIFLANGLLACWLLGQALTLFLKDGGGAAGRLLRSVPAGALRLLLRGIGWLAGTLLAGLRRALFPTAGRVIGHGAGQHGKVELPSEHETDGHEP